MPLETKVNLSDRLRSYLEAWTNLDGDEVGARYLEEGTHRGPGVVLLAPEIADHTLRGAAAIRDFVKTNNPASMSMTYKVYWVLETESTSVVEYEFMNPGRDAPGIAVEIVEWSGDKARSVRAYALTSNF